MVGVILAAGDGTRLKNSVGENICKALTKINDKYLIEFALNNLVEIGVNKAVIVVGKQGELIENTIGYEYKGIEISYVYQLEQKGLINAFIQALNVINSDENVILQLADEIFVELKTENIKHLISKMAYDFYCGITYENNLEKIKGNFSVETDENSLLKKCIEKPSVVTNNIKGTGFCIFNADTIRILKSIYDKENNIPNDLCDFLNYLTSQDKKGLAFCLAEREFNINTAFDIIEAENFLNKK